MNAQLPLNRAKEVFEDLGPVERMRENRIRLTTVREKAREAILRAMRSVSCDHLVQISAVDTGKAFELGYHLTGAHRTVVSIRIELLRDKPEMETVSDLLPPAGIYERQIHDLFGIVFLGHSDLRRLLLNEDWPADEFPLRKDWKPNPKRFYGGVHEEAR